MKGDAAGRFFADFNEFREVQNTERMAAETWAKGASKLPSAKGLLGTDFENYLTKNIGGSGEFKLSGRQFDGGVGNRWWEAKSGDYWDMIQNNPKEMSNFKSSMGQRLGIAKENGATFELFSNSPIPQSIKEWLTTKGIPYTEILY